MSHGESLLAAMLARILRGHPLRQCRPDWLHGLELDFFYPGARLAREFEGDQHYVAVYGRDALRRQRRRDTLKRRTCNAMGVILLRVDAADLSYSRLVCMLRHRFRAAGRERDLTSIALFGRDVRNEMRQVARDARKYRARLSDRYSSPSAHKRGTEIRRQKRAEFYR